jgi:hypothetical protein
MPNGGVVTWVVGYDVRPAVRVVMISTVATPSRRFAARSRERSSRLTKPRYGRQHIYPQFRDVHAIGIQVACRSRNGRVNRTVRLGAAALCVALTCTACGSSGSSGSKPPASSGGAARPPSAPATAASGTPADTATLAAINRAYATFFSSASSTPQSQAVLQHGDKFTTALEEQAKSSYATKSSASVTSARIVAPDVAAVTFSVTSGGSVLLPDAPGYAVRTGSTWQVAAQTFCGLLELEQDAPAACHDPSVTALPH